jgi:peptidoglycan/LPS O-acetylase OafA/YrhL
MKARRAAGFYFTGAIILPGFAWLAGEPLFAGQLFVFLMLAGAICIAVHRQGSDRKPPARDS